MKRAADGGRSSFDKGAVSKLIYLNENGTRFYKSGWNLVPNFIGILYKLVNTSWFETAPFSLISDRRCWTLNLRDRLQIEVNFNRDMAFFRLVNLFMDDDLFHKAIERGHVQFLNIGVLPNDLSPTLGVDHHL